MPIAWTTFIHACSAPAVFHSNAYSHDVCHANVVHVPIWPCFCLPIRTSFHLLFSVRSCFLCQWFRPRLRSWYRRLNSWWIVCVDGKGCFLGGRNPLCTPLMHPKMSKWVQVDQPASLYLGILPLITDNLSRWETYPSLADKKALDGVMLMPDQTLLMHMQLATDAWHASSSLPFPGRSITNHMYSHRMA